MRHSTISTQNRQMRISPLVLLTIAGFDPGSGAGITADLKTFAAHGAHGMSCVTALTVQSTQGVREVLPSPPSLVSGTLACLVEDVEIAGVKIGMLAKPGIVEAVADFLESAKIPRSRVVLDPVIRSSSGTALLNEDGLVRMREDLLKLVGWVTPNIEELALLLSVEKVVRESVPEMAALLAERCGQTGNDELNVVVTGGHLDRPDDYFLGSSNSNSAGQGQWIAGEWIQTTSTHGTGCAFSSALLCQLSRGRDGSEAVTGAKEYVTEALRTAYPIGKGHGPLNHLHPLISPAQV